MRLLIFDTMECCTEEEVRRLMPLASAQRRAEALKFKHTFGQYACLKSYEMLRQLVDGTDPLTFVIGEHGKPTLAELPHIHFNISHCKAAIAVAVDDKPIGIDVERFIEPSQSLLRYCMSDEEAAQVRQSEHPDREFAALWTRKEALVKYHGTGITTDLKQLLSHPDPTVRITTTLVAEKGYAVSIATETR